MEVEVKNTAINFYFISITYILKIYNTLNFIFYVFLPIKDITVII